MTQYTIRTNHGDFNIRCDEYDFSRQLVADRIARKLGYNAARNSAGGSFGEYLLTVGYADKNGMRPALQLTVFT